MSIGWIVTTIVLAGVVILAELFRRRNIRTNRRRIASGERNAETKIRRRIRLSVGFALLGIVAILVIFNVARVFAA